MQFNSRFSMKQNPDDIKKVNQFYERLSASKNAKKQLHHSWNNYLRMYRGDQWDKNRPNWKASSVNNISFSLIESIVPLMCDREPQYMVEPQTPDDVKLAKKVNLVLSFIWNDIGMNDKYVRLVRDMLKFGTGVLKVGWDPDKYNGMGQVLTEVVDPFDIFVPFGATHPDNCEFMIYRSKLPLRRIRELYPEKGMLVPSDMEYYTDDSTRDTPAKNQQFSSTEATVYEEWQKTSKGIIVCTYAGGILLEEKQNPFENDKFPFIFFWNYQLTSELWGMSELANLESLQKENNKLRSLIVDNLQTTANNVWLVDTTTGIEKNQITGRPGQVIFKNPMGKVDRVQGANLPNGLFEQLQQIKEAMEYTAGVHPITFGVSPGSVTAGSALSILTENAQVRIRGKLRNVESGLAELGKWMIVLIRQFYQEERFIKLSSDEAEGGFDFDKFNGQDLRQQEVDPVTREVTKEFLIDFDVRVVAGSSMRVNKSAKYQQAMEMYNAGALDPESLIEISEIGDKNTIFERMIKHGKMADPNNPQAKIDEMVKAITSKIKFNVSSTDPFIVENAIKEFMANVQAVNESAGMPNPATQEGQQLAQSNPDLVMQQAQKQGLLPTEEPQDPSLGA